MQQSYLIVWNISILLETLDFLLWLKLLLNLSLPPPVAIIENSCVHCWNISAGSEDVWEATACNKLKSEDVSALILWPALLISHNFLTTKLNYNSMSQLIIKYEMNYSNKIIIILVIKRYFWPCTWRWNVYWLSCVYDLNDIIKFSPKYEHFQMVFSEASSVVSSCCLYPIVLNLDDLIIVISADCRKWVCGSNLMTLLLWPAHSPWLPQSQLSDQDNWIKYENWQLCQSTSAARL